MPKKSSYDLLAKHARVDPDHPAQLLVNDNHSGRTFLIDTGAQVSLLPATAHARRHPSVTAPKLVAANGSSIASYGTQQTHVSDSDSDSD